MRTRNISELMLASKVNSLLLGSNSVIKTHKLTGSCSGSSPGGIWKSVEACVEMGATCFALFLGSQRSWKRPALDPTAAAKFREQCSLHEFDPAHVVPHGSYLMNCGSPKEGLSQTAGPPPKICIQINITPDY